jgi:hypothetical protein
MGELSFSYAQSFENIWPTWQDELQRRDPRYDQRGNVIEFPLIVTLRESPIQVA